MPSVDVSVFLNMTFQAPQDSSLGRSSWPQNLCLMKQSFHSNCRESYDRFPASSFRDSDEIQRCLRNLLLGANRLLVTFLGCNVIVSPVGQCDRPLFPYLFASAVNVQRD